MRRTLRLGTAGVAIAGAIFAGDLAAGHRLLWRSYDAVRGALASGVVVDAERMAFTLASRKKGGDWKPQASAILGNDGGHRRIRLDAGGRSFWLTTGETIALAAPPKARFEAGACDFARTRAAVTQAARTLPTFGTLERLAVSLRALPLVTGFERGPGGLRWRITGLFGRAEVFSDGFPARFAFDVPAGETTWAARFESESRAVPAEWAAPGAPAVRVDGAELDAALAAAIELVSLQWRPVEVPEDTTRREGQGVLEIRGGQRRLLLRGTAHDIGFQHGRLLKTGVERLARRMVFGIGLYYSVEKGVWFPDEARRLFARQQPFIDPAYVEELRGLAAGADLPLDLVTAANIFPEFFHCSGVAVRGKATAGGELLHARVLDYMTDAGLQDEAVVMAVAREGAQRFVNVSYSGFIGSVTGMNESRVAIGEMGGRGEGKWDGTPMSLLLRGALESCHTAAEALEYMRNRPRTCEYYYVISDGKDRSCAGIKATPEIFEIVQPGATHPQLPEPVEDAVLLSAEARYHELVRRVRAAYGDIDEETLIRILDRPVSMKSNLHNVVFAPERLTLRIANASRHEPACRRTYHAWDWDALFRVP